MEYRTLGGSGLKIPALILGTATFGGGSEFLRKWGATDVKEATDVTNTLSQNAQQKTPSDLSLQVIRDRQSMDLQASRAPRKNRPDNSFEI